MPPLLVALNTFCPPPLGLAFVLLCGLVGEGVAGMLDVGALEGKSRKLSMTHPDRVPSLRVLVVGDAGAQRVGAETALPSFQG